jgi:enoyl-CoA hydratase/carnithine racemase
MNGADVIERAAIRVALPARLDGPSLARLAAALRAAMADGDQLVLTGAGAGVFCTGLDLTQDSGGIDGARAFAEILTCLWQAPLPTLAVVDGAALGGGMGLAAACDRIIATPAATFGLPEMLWGFVPAMVWPVITTRLPAPRARWWILTGRSRTAAEALADGFIDEIVPTEKIDAVAATRARECRRSDRSAIPLLRLLAGPGVANAIAAGAEITTQRLADPGVQRRIAAFAAGEVPW